MILCTGEALQPGDSIGPELKRCSHFCPLMRLVGDLKKLLCNHLQQPGLSHCLCYMTLSGDGLAKKGSKTAIVRDMWHQQRADFVVPGQSVTWLEADWE